MWINRYTSTCSRWYSRCTNPGPWSRSCWGRPRRPRCISWSWRRDTAPPPLSSSLQYGWKKPTLRPEKEIEFGLKMLDFNSYWVLKTKKVQTEHFSSCNPHWRTTINFHENLFISVQSSPCMLLRWEKNMSFSVLWSGAPCRTRTKYRLPCWRSFAARSNRWRGPPPPSLWWRWTWGRTRRTSRRLSRRFGGTRSYCSRLRIRRYLTWLHEVCLMPYQTDIKEKCKLLEYKL